MSHVKIKRAMETYILMMVSANINAQFFPNIRKGLNWMILKALNRTKQLSLASYLDLFCTLQAGFHREGLD